MEPFSRNPSKISTNRSYKKGASLWLAVRFIRVIHHERKKEKWKGRKSHRKCLAAIAQRLASLCEIDQLCSKLRFILIDCILTEIGICIETKNTRDSYYLLRFSYVSNVVSSSCFLKCSRVCICYRLIVFRSKEAYDCCYLMDFQFIECIIPSLFFSNFWMKLYVCYWLIIFRSKEVYDCSYLTDCLLIERVTIVLLFIIFEFASWFMSGMLVADNFVHL